MYYNRIVLDRSSTSTEHTCRSLIPIKNDGNVEFRVVNCSFIEEGVGYSMVRILTDGQAEIHEGRTESPKGECVITRCTSTHYTAVILNRACFLCALVNRSHCFLMSSVPVDDNHVEWTVVGADGQAVHKLTDSLRTNGYAVTFVAGGPFAEQMALTPKEERCLKIAFTEGLYDVPRRTDLNGLCKIVGCSKSTLNVILRTAERKVISRYTAEAKK